VAQQALPSTTPARSAAGNDERAWIEVRLVVRFQNRLRTTTLHSLTIQVSTGRFVESFTTSQPSVKGATSVDPADENGYRIHSD
jgi:hypothetical protein